MSWEVIHKSPPDDVLFKELVNALEGNFGGLRNTNHGVEEAAGAAATEEEESTIGDVAKHDWYGSCNDKVK